MGESWERLTPPGISPPWPCSWPWGYYGGDRLRAPLALVAEDVRCWTRWAMESLCRGDWPDRPGVLLVHARGLLTGIGMGDIVHTASTDVDAVIGELVRLDALLAAENLNVSTKPHHPAENVTKPEPTPSPPWTAEELLAEEPKVKQLVAYLWDRRSISRDDLERELWPKRRSGTNANRVKKVLAKARRFLRACRCQIVNSGGIVTLTT